MKVYIVGYAGNMGARYRAILSHLGHDWAGIDVGKMVTTFSPEDADGIMLCSPTAQHAAHIREYLPLGKPILCEKPISKDPWDLERLVSDVQQARAKLQMVDQYRYLQFSRANSDPTTYDYFKHGSDGMAWDCINIVKHARGPVSLNETSPIWRCEINGTRLFLGDMDQAYIHMIEDWLATPVDESDEIYRAHDKIHTLMRSACAKS